MAIRPRSRQLAAWIAVVAAAAVRRDALLSSDLERSDPLRHLRPYLWNALLVIDNK